MMINEFKEMNEKVICITTGKIFDNCKKAGDYYNIAMTNISNCCRGKFKYIGKLPNSEPLKFIYLENYNNEFKGILINPNN